MSKNAKKYFAIQQAGREAEIYIYGDIVPFAWFDGDVSGQTIVNQIKGLDVDVINVHIDSYGGAVSEGWAIYNALTAHPARVVTYGDGFVASAALFPFLAGDDRYANSLSAYYLHEVMISASGYAEELRIAADEAEMMTTIGINAFVERAGMDEETVRELMKAESWLTPMEALDYGIATGVLVDAGPKLTQNAKEKIMRQMCPKWDRRPPADPKTEQKQKNSILRLFERS